MPAINRKKIIPAVVASVVALAVIIGGVLWWTNKQKYEATDNAFVQADTVQVSPQVSGYITEVLVSDNQRVEPGQVLARIDPAPFQARLDQAIANANALQAAVRGVDDKKSLEQAMIAQKAAGVSSAQAGADMAKADEARYGSLAAKGYVSPQKIQTQRAASEQAVAAVGQANAALEAERRTSQSLGSARDQMVAQAAAAQASVTQARIDLEHTVIRAPAAGVIGARAVRTGQLVQPGASLMVVVPLGQTYVVANFKETQVSRLRIGQEVEIRADAFGKVKLRGHVDSFSPAAGQQFALIPVENAVGNFTKIAQRVPVRIVVDRSPTGSGLRPGLSVEVKVDVTGHTGPSFAESGQAGPQFASRAQQN